MDDPDGVPVVRETGVPEAAPPAQETSDAETISRMAIAAVFGTPCLSAGSSAGFFRNSARSSDNNPTKKPDHPTQPIHS